MSARPLLAALLAVMSLAGCAPTGDVAAALPASGTPIPGGRYIVGDARVFALFDGRSTAPATLFVGVDPAIAAARLRAGDEAAANPDGSTAWRNTFQAFLVEVGSRRVMIDSGAGGSIPGTGGVLFALGARGIAPKTIDAVVISHMHGDHIGGLLDAAGAPRFPRAMLHLHADEAGYWGDPARAAAAPEAQRGGFQRARRVLDAYRGRVRTFRGAATIVPGLAAEPAVGHTPGHSIYRLTSRGASMAFVGDMIHSLAVQMPQPEASLSFDADADTARAARLAFLRANADGRTLLAGPHFRKPVVTLSPQGGGYRVTPVAPVP